MTGPRLFPAELTITLTCALLLSAACARPPAPESMERKDQERTEQQDREGGAPQEKTSDPSGNTPPEGEPAQATTPDAQGVRATDSPILPVDDAFLRAPLPAKNTDRYRAWSAKKRFNVGQSHLYFADWFPGEKQILVQSAIDGKVRIFDAGSSKLLGNYALSDPDRSYAPVIWPASSASEPLFLLQGPDGLTLVDARSGALRQKLSDLPGESMRWSPDKRVLTVSTSQEGSTILHFYERTDAHGLLPLGSLTIPGRVDAWDLSRDNRLLALALYPKDVLDVVDLSQGRLLFRVPLQKYVSDVAFSPDGRSVAAGGQGLLLVDLLSPDRRAYYSHFYNNINTVRFSPSGDIVATSSYDGHLRLFSYDIESQSLTLTKILRHDGRANVYHFAFSSDGNSLVSASGDQTARIFGGAPPSTKSGSVAPPQDRFRSLSEWKETAPDASRALGAEPSAADSEHPLTGLLKGQPRASRIKPGQYSCRVAEMYKMRDCSVTKTQEGHTLLEFHDGNLLSLVGLLHDDGAVTRYTAWLTSPSTIVGCAGCENQALEGVLRGQGGSIRGLLLFRNYKVPGQSLPELPADVRIEEADDRFPLTLTYKGPLPSDSLSGQAPAHFIPH